MTEKERAPTIRSIMAMRFSGKAQRSIKDLDAHFGHMECALLHDRLDSLYGMVEDGQNANINLPPPDYGLYITKVFMHQIKRWKMSNMHETS